MAKWENSKYYVDVSKYESLDEILYEFMAITTTNASKTTEEIARSYWGLGMLNVVVPKTEAMIMSQAAELEQLSINDITAIKFKDKSKEFLSNYSIDNKQLIEHLNNITDNEFSKILAYTLNTSLKVKLTPELLKKRVETLLKTSQNYSEEKFNKIKNTDYKSMIEVFESFKSFFREDFIKNKSDRLLMIKSNPDVKNAVLGLVEAIQEKNKSNIKIEELDVNIENLKSDYNFDSLIFCGNSIISDEIKSGFATLKSKYSANWKSLKSKVDVVSTIIANTYIANDLLFDTNKEAWKASNEYKELNQKLLNSTLTEEERKQLAFDYEKNFVVRMVKSTIEFNTFPEIYIHTIINKREQDKVLNNTLLQKYKKEYFNRLESLYESEEQRNVFLNYNNTQRICDFCNIMLHKGSGEYSVQVDEKMALPYLKNEIKEINYELMLIQINQIMKDKNISEKDIQEINDQLILNFHSERLISIENIKQSKEDFKSQFKFLIYKSHQELINNQYAEEIVLKVFESIDNKYNKIINNFQNIDNNTMLGIHYEIKQSLKEVFNKAKPKLLYAQDVNKLIKNIYEYMDLNNLIIDKNKIMFSNIENILTNKLGKEITKEILSSDEITTQNLRKIHHIISNELQTEVVRNLTNVGKSIAGFIHGSAFRNICATEDLKSKLLIDKENKKYFTEQLSRGVYDNKELKGTKKYNEKQEQIYTNLSKTLNIGREYIKLCVENTDKLNNIGINSFDFLTKFKYNNPEIISNDNIDNIKKEYEIKESLIKDLNEGLKKLIDKKSNKEEIENFISTVEMLITVKTQLCLNKNIKINKIIEKQLIEEKNKILKEERIKIKKEEITIK